MYAPNYFLISYNISTRFLARMRAACYTTRRRNNICPPGPSPPVSWTCALLFITYIYILLCKKHKTFYADARRVFGVRFRCRRDELGLLVRYNNNNNNNNNNNTSIVRSGRAVFFFWSRRRACNISHCRVLPPLYIHRTGCIWIITILLLLLCLCYAYGQTIIDSIIIIIVWLVGDGWRGNAIVTSEWNGKRKVREKNAVARTVSGICEKLGNVRLRVQFCLCNGKITDTGKTCRIYTDCCRYKCPNFWISPIGLMVSWRYAN